MLHRLTSIISEHVEYFFLMFSFAWTGTLLDFSQLCCNFRSLGNKTMFNCSPFRLRPELHSRSCWQNIHQNTSSGCRGAVASTTDCCGILYGCIHRHKEYSQRARESERCPSLEETVNAEADQTVKQGSADQIWTKISLSFPSDEVLH